MAKRLKDVRGKLQLSKLEGQKELLSNDVDLTQIAFITRNLPTMRFEEAVVDGSEINRTIEGASTVKLNVTDNDGIISRSGRIASKVDIKVDGLWFRLVQARKQHKTLSLTFESREVAVLRTYNKKRLAGWGKMSRARFAEILINEARELNIPFVTPDPAKLKKERNKAEKAKERNTGFGFRTNASLKIQAGKGLTIKGVEATPTQLRVAEDILDVGAGMLVKRKFLVVAMMTAIQESTMTNLTGGHGTSVGVFQEIDIWGTVAERRNVRNAARRFYERAIAYEKDHPKAKYVEIAQGAQQSQFPDAYGQHQPESERLVTAYGLAGGDISTNADVAAANNMGAWADEASIDDFQFMRGHIKTLPGGKKEWELEHTWDCLNRLAEEVQWRCFEVSGTIYFVSEPWLFKSAPRARITERSGGVDWIDYDFDINKKAATITISARVDQWECPPGAVIEIYDMGVINGRWLVTEINRPFFSPDATITCKKPRPILPEPKKEDLTGLWDNQPQQSNVYVPTPGFQPDLPNGVPTGRALRDAVLNNARITFTRPSQSNDITFGLIDDKVLIFMLLFVEAGFPITVTALRSDHNKLTSSGNVSAHSKGLAVDLGNYGEGNPKTDLAMQWIGDHQVQLKFSQLIGPNDSLVIPLGHYDNETLQGHDDHIHVGWPI